MLVHVFDEIEQGSAVKHACVVVPVGLAAAIQFEKTEYEATSDFVDACTHGGVKRSLRGSQASHTVTHDSIVTSE